MLTFYVFLNELQPNNHKIYKEEVYLFLNEHVKSENKGMCCGLKKSHLQLGLAPSGLFNLIIDLYCNITTTSEV